MTRVAVCGAAIVVLIAGLGEVAGARQAEPPVTAGGWVESGLGAGGALPAASPGHTAATRVHGTTHVRYVTEYQEPSCTRDRAAVAVVTVDIATGRRVPGGTYHYCGTLVAPQPTEPSAALPVEPPSPEEVWGLLPIEQPAVAISPRVKGLVGFETWLWHEGDTELRLPEPLPLGEWRIDVNAKAVHYRWDMGDGGTVDGDQPGADGQPTDTYAYQYPCTCQVTATVTWAGSYTVTGPGVGPVTIDLGTREFTGPPLAYPVREVQAVIVG